MRFRTLIFLIAFGFCYQVSFSQNDWENELMFEQNKLRSRVPSYSYTNHTDALEGIRENSRILSLNGTWKFNYVDKSQFTRVPFIHIQDSNQFSILQEKINFRDKIVIVGTAAKGIKDIFTIPSGTEY